MAHPITLDRIKALSTKSWWHSDLAVQIVEHCEGNRFNPSRYGGTTPYVGVAPDGSIRVYVKSSTGLLRRLALVMSHKQRRALRERIYAPLATVAE